VGAGEGEWDGAVTAAEFAIDVANALGGYRLRWSTEEQLQERILLALMTSGMPFLREYNLGQSGRIDFYNPEHRVGLEVKVKGSSALVTRQLYRYAENDQVDALVLVTSKARHATALPEKMNGKVIRVVTLWRSGL